MAINDHQANKTSLRRSLLQQRRALSPELWRDRSHSLCHRIQSLPQFQSAQIILAYHSFRQEPDLTLLWQDNRQKEWGFPRCVGQDLHWHYWQPGDRLITSPYGIPEPDPAAPAIALNTADLILVPAVGCDRQGHRLGYGGGYYDRALAHPTAQAHPPTTLGIIFDASLLAQLPSDPWDQPLSGICTESQTLWFPRPKVEG